MWIGLRFGFQPRHSAIEFRRGLRQYFSDFQTVALLSGHEITRHYHHETIFLPIYFYLRSLGVDFRFNTTVSQIVTTPNGCSQTISRLDIVQEGYHIHQDIRAQDIVLATLGSTVSGCAIGTNEYPPALQSMEPAEELDENWSIWLELGSKHAKFGNPYNFCTRRSQSTLVSFTITTEDLAFFQHVSRLSCLSPVAGTFVLEESQWKINLCIPRQGFVQGQPVNVRILWGYALAPGTKGDFVDKPMLYCSGAEILSEILSHLDYSSELLVQRTVVIPRIIPRMTSFFISRYFNDCPQVLPPNTTNIGLVGQFVELPYHSCVDLSYGVLAAKIAVFSLMDSDKPCVKLKIPFLTVLRAMLWR
jgi:oleate hydratase